MQRCKRFAAIAIVVAGGTGAQAQNLIVNGSFEKPVVTAGGTSSFVTGDAFFGWNVVGANGDVAVTSDQFASRGFVFPAQSGAQWLDLSGTLDMANVGVEQTVSTTRGAKYELAFSVGNVFDAKGPFGTSSRVDVFINGVLAMSAIALAGNDATMTWQNFSYKFVAGSGKTTIAFINADPQGDQICGLDSVSLLASANSRVEDSAAP